MPQRFWVIGYRPPGQAPLFFRGNGRYAVTLPSLESDSWVKDILYARLFVRPPDFLPNCISKTLDATCVAVYPYEGSVDHNHVIMPTVRPSSYKIRFNKSGKGARKMKTVPTRDKPPNTK